jgi:hypothetical protein
MVDRHFALIRRALFMTCALFCIQVLNFAQTTPQSAMQDQNPPISIRKRGSPLIQDIVLLVRMFRLDVIFDDSVKDSKLTIDLKDVPIKKVIKTILESKKLNARLKDEKFVVIFADTPENREKYSDLKSWPEESAK